MCLEGGFSLNFLDVCFFFICLGSSILGARRGFIEEAGRFLPWAGACFLPFRYTKVMAVLLKGLIPKAYVFVTGGVLVFLFSFILLKIAVRALAFVVALMPLTIVMQPLGFLLGLARGLLICIMLLMALQLSPWAKEAWVRQAWFYGLYGADINNLLKKYLFKRWVNKFFLMV